MQPLDPVFLIIILVMSVVIHEVSHGYVAYFLGDPTAHLSGRLTLNPLAHLDWFGSFIVPLLLYMLPGGLMFGWAKPVPYNPYNLRGGKWGPAYVALAGPASNLLVAVIFGLALRFTLVPVVAGSLVISLVVINLMLAVFNLLPIAPLDGSKVLFAVMPNSLSWFTSWWERHQFLILIIFIFLLSSSDFLQQIITWLLRLIVGI